MYTKSQILVWAFSLATNALCTLLIGVKAWRHRKTMRELSLTVKYDGMSTEKILSLLVESGFIYSLLWAVQILGYLEFPLDSPWNIISEVVVRIGRQLTGMYPTLIIVIVNFKRTIWEEYPTSTPDHGLHSLKWAAAHTGLSGTTSTETRPEGIHPDIASEVMRPDFAISQRDNHPADSI
ncbi:hypothetical protein C8R47DRAFT_134802 [Mycena vitilis]|nr:hypothetical protein C8R47DRAFT_134802 [Mycena vitilis]